MTKVMTGILFNKLNGRTTRGIKPLVNKRIACAIASSNYWSSTENSGNNAWNVNFGGTNSNNNNKNNSNYVRAVAALDDEEKASVMEAYDDCCRNKMGSPDCIEFRLHPETIIVLAVNIKMRCYQPGLSKTFIVKRPKLREIFAAFFLDRIVQHWIYLRINPLFEERFVSMGNVSYNCRKGFGTLAARLRLYNDMHKHGFSHELFIGKFDLFSCFMSTDKEVLWAKLEEFIPANYKGDDLETLMYLLKITVFHRPQDLCERRGDLSLWGRLAKEKSLFYCNGLPIGNITTQILLNFLLSYFDEWILWRIATLGYEHPEEHYLRFVDDFPIHSMPVEHITLLHRESRVWLWENLHFRMHPDKVYIQPQFHGVKFVGGVILQDRMYIINRTVAAMYLRVNYTEILCRVIIEKGATETRLSLLQHCVSSLNSYSGFLVHGKSYNLQKKLLLPLQWFWKVCYTKGNLNVVVIKKQYKLTNYLIHEQELQCRITDSLRPRHRESFPDDKFLRRARIW